MGALVAEVICGGIGRGACIRAQLEPVEAQDTADWADKLENMDAWPEEPELVDETDMRGR